MLYGTANLLRDRETTLADLYSEEKGSIDMVIVGSSHVNNGIIPNIFWEENGISATNAYSWAQPTWTAYYYIREALRVQDPDIVILDLYGMTYGNSYIMPEEIDRINYENSFNIDMNLNFLGLIRTSEKVGLDLRYYEDFLNLPRYHTRWKDLDSEDADLRSPQRPGFPQGVWVVLSGRPRSSSRIIRAMSGWSPMSLRGVSR